MANPSFSLLIVHPYSQQGQFPGYFCVAQYPAQDGKIRLSFYYSHGEEVQTDVDIQPNRLTVYLSEQSSEVELITAGYKLIIQHQQEAFDNLLNEIEYGDEYDEINS